MFIRIGCAALIACASLSTAAYAGPAESKTEVAFGDLDLATPAGVKTLHQRISAAATKVCAKSNSNETDKLKAMMACRRIALQQAQPAIELAVNSAKSGERLAQNTINLTDR